MSAVRPLLFEGGVPHQVRGLVTQGPARPARELAQHGAHRPRRVIASSLANLEVGVYAAPVARRAGVQEIAERQQRRRLAGLARRVQYEVPLVANQAEDFVKVDPRQRCDLVVTVDSDRTGSVERAHGRGPLFHGAVWLSPRTAADSTTPAPLTTLDDQILSHALDLVEKQAHRPGVEASLLTQRQKPSNIVCRALPVDTLDLRSQCLEQPLVRDLEALALPRTLLQQGVAEQRQVGNRPARYVPEEIVPVAPLDIAAAQQGVRLLRNNSQAGSGTRMRPRARA